MLTTHTHTGHAGFTFIHIIFPTFFYLILVTSRNSLPNCQDVPSYQQRGQNNLIKAFVVLHVKVLTGFKDNFIAPNGKTFSLDTCVNY